MARPPGPVKPLTAEQQALAADPRAANYALRIARQFARSMRREHLRDEFESAALVAVVLAARGYDPARGADFVKTYLPRVVVHHLIAANNLWQPRGYMQRPKNRPAVATLPPDLPGADDPVGWALEYEDEVEGLVATLPPDEAEALRRRHLRPDTRVEDVARLLGVGSAGAAQRILGRIYREARGRAA